MSRTIFRVGTPDAAGAAKTPIMNIRVPRSMWAAYGRVCARLGRDRTEDLLDRMRERIEQHGDAADLADLAAADAELAERRARKGGRPPKADKTA